MENLHALREMLFPGPVTQIFYAEPSRRRIIEDIVRECRIDLIADTEVDPGTLRALAAGTYPVLIQRYEDFRFEKPVPEYRLRDYLRERPDRPAPRVFATFTDRCGHVGIFLRFFECLGDRPCRTLGVEKDLKHYCAAFPGEHLVIATFSHAPVPGEAVRA